MKKVLLLFAVALMVAACNGQGDKNQEQNDDKKVIVPPGMPVAPTTQVPPSTGLSSEQNTNPNAPVLKLEEGKPLDFSQLMGERKTLQQQATERIDSIRYHAEQGNADYQYMFGLCFENGWGVDENPQQAAVWYKKAADQQQKASYNALGNLYRTGKGVKHNDKEAFKWFQKGDEADDAQAMLNLGNCHYFGMGTEKNLNEAVTWWQKSADGDNAYATASAWRRTWRKPSNTIPKPPTATCPLHNTGSESCTIQDKA